MANGMSNSRVKSAFTLVEILVAIAALSILVLLILQMLTMATKTVSVTETRMNVEGQVRTVFATMGNDLSHMLRRSDADCIVGKVIATGNSVYPNDYLYFYSETPGYFPGQLTTPYWCSTLSVIGYWINPTAAAPYPAFAFQRLAKGLSWDDVSGSTISPLTGGPVFVTYATSYPLASGAIPNANSLMEYKWSSEIPPPTSPVVTSAGTNPLPPQNPANYQTIGEEIFRMEICFLRTDGTFCDQAYLTDPTHVYGLQDVRAVIVTLAVISDADRKIVPNMSKLVQAFKKSNLTAPVTQPTLPATTWMNALNSGTFAATAGVPARVANDLRVYQHFFYLGKN